MMIMSRQMVPGAVKATLIFSESAQQNDSYGTPLSFVIRKIVFLLIY